MWPAVLAASVGCFLLKLLGHSVPTAVLDRPYVRRAAAALPVALLAALVAVQALAAGEALVVDARIGGLAAAAVALLLRAPFLVVVVVAMAVAAALRALGVAV